jgi:hypothetical protein
LEELTHKSTAAAMAVFRFKNIKCSVSGKSSQNIIEKPVSIL